MCKICNNDNLEGLKELDCTNCPLLTIIPNIKGLKRLKCSNCPLLTIISYIKGLRTLWCSNCPLLKTIPNIEGLEYLYCNNCTLITEIPNIGELNKYINYLEINYYSNPQLPYMKYYIENKLYDEDKKEFRIGYINSKEMLVWYKVSY